MIKPNQSSLPVVFIIIACWGFLTPSVRSDTRSSQSSETRPSDAGNLPVHTAGYVLFHNKIVPFDALYWGNRCRSIDLVPVPDSLPQPWLEARRRFVKATSIDEIFACFNKDSQPVLEKQKNVFEKI